MFFPLPITPITKILAIISVVLALAVGGVGWYAYKTTLSLGAEKGRTAQAVQAVNDMTQQLRKTIEDQEFTGKLLAERETEAAALREQAKVWRSAYDKLLKTDKVAKEWSDTVIPPGIVDLLRDSDSR
jgi:uncharacterized protein HemX